MPDLTDLPGQTKPKVYGAPVGLQEPVQATDRNTAQAATDAQVKAAYQAYMRQVVAAAHAHFADHLEAQKPSAAPTTPATNQSLAPVPLGSGIADQGARIVSGGVPRIEKAVADAGG